MKTKPRAKSFNIKLNEHVELHVHRAGYYPGINRKLPSGVQLHIDIKGILGPGVKLKPHQIAAISYGFTGAKITRLFNRALKLMEG